MFKQVTTVVFAMLFSLLIAPVAEGHERQIGFHELVHTADAIFIGRVANIESFETDALVGTRVSFNAISPIVSRSTANPFMGDVIAIEYAGGTIGGRTSDVCCAPVFSIGEEVLVMAQLDGGRYFNPFAGGRQGLFRIMRDEHGQPWPLAWSHRGLVPDQLLNIRKTDPVEFIQDGRPSYLDMLTTEPVEAPVSVMSGGLAVSLTGIRPESIVSLEAFIATIEAVKQLPAPASLETRVGKRAALGEVSKVLSRPLPDIIPTNLAGPQQRGLICLCHHVDPYQNMQQVPESWGDTWRDNNNSMSNWQDLADLFRYNDTDWGWSNNGDSEFCGWPDASDISDEYSNWTGWGANTLAMCVNEVWCTTCCRIREADILFNSAFTWYYDLDSVIGTTGSQALYRPTVSHELGHSVGVETGDCGVEDYQYNQPCTMSVGASQSIVENGYGVHALDAAGIRALYSDFSFEDAGVESWYSSGDPISAQLLPDSIIQGESFSIYGISVENISSMSQSDVRVRIYLSSNKTITEYDHLVDELNFPSMLKDSYWSGDVLDIPVNFAVDPGTYYVGLMVTLDGDDYADDEYSSNDTTWIPDTIVIGEGNPFDHWEVATYLAFDFLHASWYVNSANSGDGGESSCSENSFGGVWTRIRAPHFQSLLRAAMGGSGTGLNSDCASYVQVYKNNDGQPGQLIGEGCHTCQDPLEVMLSPHDEYFIKVGGLDEVAAEGWLSLELVPSATPGDHHSFPIPMDQNAVIGNLDGMTPSLGGPVCNQTDAIDAWYIVKAPAFFGESGTMWASTCSPNTNFDTTLSVFTMNMEQVTCNDNSPCGDDSASTSSRVEWSVIANQSYLVRVGGPGQDLASYNMDCGFNGTPSPWDGCDTAFPMNGASQEFNTWGALDSGIEGCEDNEITFDVWMKWEAPTDGWVLIGTCPDIGGSASFDTVVAVHSECTSGEVLGCNDDAANDGTSIVELQVYAGKSYYIQVGSPALEVAERGRGVLAISYFEPDSSPCEGDHDNDGQTGINDLLWVLDNWGEEYEDGVVDINDLLFVIEHWGCN